MRKIGAQVDAVAAVGFEQYRARGETVLHHDAGVKAEIGADVDEDIRRNLAADANEALQFPVFADMGGNFETADILRVDQKIGAEIAANEIMPAMNEPIKRLVEAAPPLVPPPGRKIHAPPSGILPGAFVA